MKLFLNSIKLLRPAQWMKNLFIFLPAFFGAKLLNLESIQHCLLAFIGFSFVASSIYSFNDIIDCQLDKLHPTKKNRPIASGDLSKNQGFIIMAISLIIGFGILFLGKAQWQVIMTISFYYLLNILYTLKLKKYALIDVTIIATGFIFRLLVGSFAGDVVLSDWIIIMTFLLALFLAIAKRRDEFMKYNETGVFYRKHLPNYNKQFLELILSILGTIIIIAYLNYTLSSSAISNVSDKLYFTTVFVMLGIFRFLQITVVYNRSGDPTAILLKDRVIQLCILAWSVFFALFLYVIPKSIIN